MRPTPRPGILQIANYVSTPSVLSGVAQPALLAANESPLGPSLASIVAARAACQDLHRYPDSDTLELNRAIAEQHGLSASWIMCGTGSESLIEVICRTFAGPGDEVLVPELSFPMFSIYAKAAGATVVVAPARQWTADPETLVAAVTERTRIVFIANPNNPTGTWLDAEAIANLVKRVPKHVLIVLDSAYAEYLAQDSRYNPGHAHVTAHPERVMVLRTFSKLYALAALRIGWMHADPVNIDYVRRARLIFPVTAPSQAAAIAALSDRAHVDRSVEHNRIWRGFLERELRTLGVEVVPSGANFVLVHFPKGWESAEARLRAGGVLARPIPSMKSIRISVGLEAENRAVVDALRDLT